MGLIVWRTTSSLTVHQSRLDLADWQRENYYSFKMNLTLYLLMILFFLRKVLGHHRHAWFQRKMESAGNPISIVARHPKQRYFMAQLFSRSQSPLKTLRKILSRHLYFCLSYCICLLGCAVLLRHSLGLSITPQEAWVLFMSMSMIY